MLCQRLRRVGSPGGGLLSFGSSVCLTLLGKVDSLDPEETKVGALDIYIRETIDVGLFFLYYIIGFSCRMRMVEGIIDGKRYGNEDYGSRT